MAGLKFLSLATAAIFCLAKEAHGDDSSVKYSAKRVDCLAAMNAARSTAGFVELQLGEEAESQLPIYSKPKGRSTEETLDQDYLGSVCESMRANEATVKKTKVDGTYAYAVQEGTDADCQAAVDHWKEALANFGGLPPAYSSTESPYTSAQNISLIALFNPKESPKVDCAYFTCPEKKAQAEAGENTAEKEMKALLCVTTPNALTENEVPYSQEQWDRITKAINSGSAAVPTFFAVAAAAVAALFL